MVASVQAKGKLQKVPANVQVPFGFKKGDHMCISHKAQTFQQGHNEKWTKEIFEVYQPFRKVGLTSSTVGWLWIRLTTSRYECHILFYERHQSEGDTTSRTGYGEQRMFAI